MRLFLGSANPLSVAVSPPDRSRFNSSTTLARWRVPSCEEPSPTQRDLATEGARAHSPDARKRLALSAVGATNAGVERGLHSGDQLQGRDFLGTLTRSQRGHLLEHVAGKRDKSEDAACLHGVQGGWGAVEDEPETGWMRCTSTSVLCKEINARDPAAERRDTVRRSAMPRTRSSSPQKSRSTRSTRRKV